jgi:hemerythrin-like domain-containing protein
MTILKADHREVKRLLTLLAESSEGEKRNKMVSDVEQALTLHMAIEEKYLYPRVAKKIGAEEAEEAEIEHGLARDGLAKVSELVDKPGFGAAVEMLKAGLAHHVKEEETELLPELKRDLRRDKWLALGDKIAKAKADAGAPLPVAPRRKPTKRVAKK